VKGKISGEEDLQVDGKVEGPISLQGQRLTVGRTGQLNSEVNAREVVVYGKVHGNLRASDRVEIKKDGSVTGDVITARGGVRTVLYNAGTDNRKVPVLTKSDQLVARRNDRKIELVGAVQIDDDARTLTGEHATFSSTPIAGSSTSRPRTRSSSWRRPPIGR